MRHNAETIFQVLLTITLAVGVVLSVNSRYVAYEITVLGLTFITTTRRSNSVVS